MVIGSYRARSRLGRFTWLWYRVDYMLLLCLTGWNASLGWYGVLSSLHYFYFTFTSVHYTSSYTGKVAVLAMLLPMRVSTSCGDLYPRILSTACFISTDQLAVRGLSADLFVIYGSICLAVLFLSLVSFYSSWGWCAPRATLVWYIYIYFLLILPFFYTSSG